MTKEYPVKGYNLFSPIVHKRKEFIQENELRVFQQIDEAVHNEKYWDSQSNQIGKLIFYATRKISGPSNSIHFCIFTIKGFIETRSDFDQVPIGYQDFLKAHKKEVARPWYPICTPSSTARKNFKQKLTDRPTKQRHNIRSPESKRVPIPPSRRQLLLSYQLA